MYNITKVLRAAIKHHLDVVFGKDPFRYANDDRALISTDVQSAFYFVNPYNEEVSDFCVNFFKKLQSEGLSIEIHDSVKGNLYVGYRSTIDMKKIANDLLREISDHFNP